MKNEFSRSTSRWLAGALLAATLLGCSKPPPAPPKAPPTPEEKSKNTISKAAFGTMPDGTAVDLFTMVNANGMEVRATNYGGIITALLVPDGTGKATDVTLGLKSFDDYVKNPPYFGAIIGRYGNRIAKGQFKIDDQTFKLPKNDGPNTLHGGVKGFDKVVWQAEPFEKEDSVGVIFTYTSKDGEEGFPGNLQTRVTYTLTDKNELSLDYHATTDKPTVVNLTQHAYFNLAGDGNGDVLGHEFTIYADGYTPVNKQLIPTGKIEPVTDTPFDFRNKVKLADRVNVDNEQIKFGKGIDHNFVLKKKDPKALTLAARVSEPTTRRVMEVHTTEPGVQFYTGNFLDDTLAAKAGKPYAKHSGFCLETQHFPDSPNQPEFPSTVLRPGEEYNSKTVYTFSVR
ncbi:aldose epimerase family protein [Steroidobacter agaridevorans]|uniref:aldose epimerase family protein n=1 Tax=Steroidobacter agaridevorans TaxID=2695856 RepID=UPI00132AF1A6|nr:aldose epimerase family protein [Steroidobacter agaridevorans]GFE89016.1 aldose 1-epimerase [Steroidobacter agaridevorans]